MPTSADALVLLRGLTCTNNGICRLLGPLHLAQVLEGLVVLALLGVVGCCCCVAGSSWNRRLCCAAYAWICACGVLYKATHLRSHSWKPPTLDHPYDEWRMSVPTLGPPSGMHNLTTRLDKAVRRHRRRFHAARPFKHVAVNNLLPRDIIDAVAAELPDKVHSGCAIWSQSCYLRKGSEYRKSELAPEAFGPATRALFRELRSARFVQFLEKLSGVHGLFPDPTYRGSGVHLTADGGYLNVHADFNSQPDDVHNMHRRVNLFIYLTAGWREEYGGHLELWNRGMDRCDQRILPRYGRFVMFLSDSFSYHGHPVPMDLPPNVLRRSVAFYYYTKGRPRSECIEAECKKHGTLFQVSRCGQCAAPACRARPENWRNFTLIMPD